MERSVTWLDHSESESSPSLSERVPLKRKKSNIFTRLRNSILGNTTEESEKLVNEETDDNVGLMSMDAGLQKRISQLASTVKEEETTTDDNLLERTNSKRNSLKRSKSLVSSPTSLNTPNSGFSLGSQLQSPKSEVASTFDEKEDSMLQYTKSLISMELSSGQSCSNNSSFQIFNCSWLAPTRKGQLFLGKLILMPSKSEIQFHYQHATRTIKLKFQFQDILNIARGAWNDRRNQALIIDLMLGKRKTWVFVAWKEDQFREAVDCIVRAWRCHNTNRIKERINRKDSLLKMKYDKVVKESDLVAINMVMPLHNILLSHIIGWINFLFQTNDDQSDEITTLIHHHSTSTLKNLLVEEQIDGIIPQVLADIFIEKATTFMTNFRELQGVVILNDSGWSEKTNERSFTVIITRESSKRKWRIMQRVIVDTSDFVLLESIMTSLDHASQIFKLHYEIERIPSQLSCNLRIFGELEGTSARDRKYLINEYLDPMMDLLLALIRKSENEFEFDASEKNLNISPPYYRFMKEKVRGILFQADLLVTTLILPALYKISRQKRLTSRSGILSLVLILGIIVAAGLFTRNQSNQSVNIESEFVDLIGRIQEKDHRKRIQIILTL